MLGACSQEQSNEEGKRARIERSTKDRQEVEPAPTPPEELEYSHIYSMRCFEVGIQASIRDLFVFHIYHGKHTVYQMSYILSPLIG